MVRINLHQYLHILNVLGLDCWVYILCNSEQVYLPFY